ncbi:hypothetical protein C6P46_007154 [Rhodotorula mucilaginosa]|uniref:Uncharacterized protein n=1 Tax=Rhodotorula mucilaginosa TaxID=5537 RepID=A0A9P7B338_RHOMI|nr:hypothetical protein C6P46_007154 [Rhodotorula mucilaginosa]
MSALFAPVQKSTKSATTKKNADPVRQQPSPTTPTRNRPTNRRPKRLLASENEVEQWEREADRVDELRRAKTPRTAGDGDDEMAAVVAVEDEGMTTAGGAETKEKPLSTREEEEEEEPAAAILRPITFLHPSRPANNRVTTTATHKPVPPARKPDKAPVAAAVYDLSSLAPIVSRRPKMEASDPPPPQKPKVRPGQAAPQPVALSKLTSAVFVPVDETKKKKKEPPQAPQAALSAFRPPPPVLAASYSMGMGMDDGQDGQEIEVEEWSPKKRKGGYLARVFLTFFFFFFSGSGMAARASSLLSAARTEQTLWLHDFSRRLAATASTSNGRRTTTATTTLAADLRPDLRLKVLQVLSFGNDEADSFMTSDRRRERRTTLAVCRLLGRENRDRPADAASSSSMGETNTRETQGLVLFSLHDHHFGGSSTSSVPLPSPTKRPRPDSDSDPSSSSSSSSTARTLAVPTIPPDLRLIRPGVEVWVWEPFHEVTLLGAEDVRFDEEQTASSSSAVLSERGTPVPVGDVSVRWQNGGAAAADGHGEAELSVDSGSEAVAKKGLVCGRFAILA